MSATVTPIDISTHKKTFINPAHNYKHAEPFHIIPALVNEVIAMSGNFPVVFVKDSQSGQFRLAALLGLSEGKNLIFSQHYANSNYVPLMIRRYPYVVLTSDNSEHFSIGLDHSCEWINEGGLGYPLFGNDGSPSKELDQIAEFLADMQKSEQTTNEFIRFIVSNELLTEADLIVTMGADSKKKLSGLYQIDIEKLNKLNDDTVLELHNRRFNPAIYAHIASLYQIQKLVNLSAKL